MSSPPTLAEFLGLYGALLRGQRKDRGALLRASSSDPDIPRWGRIQATLMALEARDRISLGEPWEAVIPWYRSELSEVFGSDRLGKDDKSLDRRIRRATQRWDAVGAVSPLAPELLRMPRMFVKDLGLSWEIHKMRSLL